MPSTFWVKEINSSGEKTENLIEADSKEDIYEIVKSRGSTLIKIEERTAGKSGKSFSELGQIEITKEKITIKDLAIFCKQANTMLSAGMSLTRTLDVLAIQSANKRFKKIIMEIASEIQKGYQFSVALKMHSDIFPPLFISMIESGELTGNLDAILLSLSVHYNKEYKIQSKVKSASIYPLVIGVVALLVLGLMLVWVVPMVTEIFVEGGNELPAITQGLISLSNFVIKSWYLIIVGIIVAIFLFKQLLKLEEFRFIVNKIVRKLPVVGIATTKIATARFSRTLSTLLRSGIPLVQALKAASIVTNNLIVIRGIREISEEVKKGQSLNLLLNNLKFFPTMMVSMVAIGEESGDLEGLLERTADYYDDEMEETMDSLTSVIEPIFIVIMALIVGYMVIALMLPIFDMASNLI